MRAFDSYHLNVRCLSQDIRKNPVSRNDSDLHTVTVCFLNPAIVVSHQMLHFSKGP